jgi:hypothetical protein
VHGTSHAIGAEQLLNRARIAFTMVPVPRHPSSNCGVCIRIDRVDVESARRAPEAGGLQIEGIHEI